MEVDTRIDVLDLYCAVCRRPYDDVADQSCEAAQDNSHLIGGPGPHTRRKRNHDHDCTVHGCDPDLPALRRAVGLTSMVAGMSLVAAMAIMVIAPEVRATTPAGPHASSPNQGVFTAAPPVAGRPFTNRPRHAVNGFNTHQAPPGAAVPANGDRSSTPPLGASADQPHQGSAEPPPTVPRAVPRVLSTVTSKTPVTSPTVDTGPPAPVTARIVP